MFDDDVIIFGGSNLKQTACVARSRALSFLALIDFSLAWQQSFFSHGNCKYISKFIKNIRLYFGLDGCADRFSTFYSLDFFGFSWDREDIFSLGTSNFKEIGTPQFLSLSGTFTWILPFQSLSGKT